jgi:hypothetical protein
MHVCLGNARNSTAGPAVTFFTLEARIPQRVIGHMAALEPSSAGTRGPEPRDAWEHRIPPQRGGEIQSRGHVVALEPSSTGRHGPEL